MFDFNLQQIHLGEDADGDAVTSCVVHAMPPKSKAETVDKTKGQRRFRAAYDKVRAVSPQGDALLSDVRDAFVATVAAGERDRDKASRAKRNAWSRAMDELPAGLEIVGDYVRAVGVSSPLEEFEAIPDLASQTSHSVSMRH